MKNSIILAGVAALAFTAPVLAQPGKGGGGGNKGGGSPAKIERGGGGPQMRGKGGGGPKQQEMRGNRGPERAKRGGGGSQQARGSERREVRADRPKQRIDRGPVREARNERGPAKAQKGNGNQRLTEDRDRTRVDSRVVQRQDRGNAETFQTQQRSAYFASPSFRSTGLVDGCPPGLAAKGNGCLPPGQARKLVGAAIPVALGSALLPTDYRNWYPDNDDYFYRTSDGYVYRIDRDRNYVDAYWPLADDWNGAYYVGAAYPQDYVDYYNVPVQYQPWYADNGEDYYRYGDGAIYQVDREGGLIESIVSLLAGGVGVGQPLPEGYDVYNVPYEYRDRYVDSADSMYRYNDGYIYEVDPTTRIVQAIVETLV
jgi:hypothetical protein